jgi:protein adenylyltransferase
MRMELSQSYAKLPETFYERIPPSPVREPRLVLFNAALARDLQLSDELVQDRAALAQYFSGNELLAGSEPIATAYAGHQFGHFVPQLGDGRAHLLGEVIDRAGRRREIQLKGSGRTSYSRGGDGRCALGPALREFIMSEALHALGVPTTRCLAVVTSGEPVLRETPQPGAVVTRVASSHLRVGTFQFFAARRDLGALQALSDFAIERHYPELVQEHAAAAERYLGLLDRVIARQIQLVVEWMRIGFIHGVMNTDNTAISGETIDYGPCAMMSRYDPQTVFSSIDHQGRYAFANQPVIAAWNLTRLAECLLPLVAADEQTATDRLGALLGAFPARFEAAYLQMMGRKLGLSNPQPGDLPLVTSLLEQLEARGLDYTVTFQRLGRSLTADASAHKLEGALEGDLGDWFGRWQRRLADQDAAATEVQASMARHNPVVIPRNHHVEAVLRACEETGEAAAAEDFLEVLRSPYQELPRTARFQDPPADGDRGYQTFCGT